MEIKIKRIWAAPETAAGSRYALRLWGRVAGIVALAVLLPLGGTLLTMAMGWPREPILLALCLGTAALAAWLAVGAGRSALRAATVFLLTESDRLFVVDARELCPGGRGALSNLAAAAQVQEFLRRLAAKPFVPYGAWEVLRVDSVRENRTHYALRCELRRAGGQGRAVRQTRLLARGLPDQDLLLRELERRQSWQTTLEPRENRGPLYIALSGAALAACAALCAASHPAVGRLPQQIYFPCLGAAFVALYALVYFIVRYRRGE